MGLPFTLLNENLADFSVKKRTKLRFGSVIKSIIQSVQVFSLCDTFDNLNIRYTKIIK